MIKRISALLLVFMLLFTLSAGYCEETANGNEKQEIFSDIEGSWAKEDIKYLVENGIVLGRGDGLFAPNENISRAEFATMIFNALKLSPIDYEGVYPDVSNDAWYADTVQTLYELELLDKEAFSETFKGEKAITREEMASLLVNGYKLYLNLADDNADMNYSDADQFSAWAVRYINAAGALGIMQGKEGNVFDAKGLATREETAAVIRRLLDAFTKANLNVKSLPWRQAPIIYRLMDEIKPGEAFHIYGYGLDDKNVVVYAESGLTAGDKPSADAVELEVVQRDPEGHYIGVILDKDFTAGVYKVWTKNKYGISNGLYLNSAMPKWISMDCAYEGLELQLIGVNLQSERFGAEGETKVRLVNNGQSYDMKIVSVEPYCVKFVVPEGVPEGVYDIEVTNNGVNWNVMNNEQEFKIVSKGTDPYNLGVAWEKNYKYDKKLNVKDFGVKGDGISDDTEAIQRVLDKAGELGGAIVYFPKGNYRTSKMVLSAYTILEGESRTESIITYTGNDPEANFVSVTEEASNIGYNGFTKLTFKMDDSNPEQNGPANIMWLGAAWDNNVVYNWSKRPYEGVFLTEVNLDFPMERRGTAEQTSYVLGSKYMIIKNCNMKGYRGLFYPANIHYQIVKDNYFSTTVTSNHNVGGFAIFENNEIQLRPEYVYGEPSVESQGIFLKTQFYVAHNKIYGAGAEGPSNDGEIVCSENTNGGTITMIGDVVTATANTITVNPVLRPDGTVSDRNNYNGWEPATPRFGQLLMHIIGGKGMGQYRRVIALDQKTYTVHEPWDIVPDSTSKFILATTSLDGIIYANHAESCQKGFWLYGGAIGCIIADNEGIGTDGAYTLAFDIPKDRTNTYRLAQTYFNMIKGNKFNGVARSGGTCSITSAVSFESPNLRSLGYNSFGMAIKDNSMKNALGSASADKVSEAPSYSGIMYIVTSTQLVPESYMAKAAIIEGNSLVNMENGIVVGTSLTSKFKAPSVTGVIIKDNFYNNVKKRLIINDAKNVVKINE